MNQVNYENAISWTCLRFVDLASDALTESMSQSVAAAKVLLKSLDPEEEVLGRYEGLKRIGGDFEARRRNDPPLPLKLDPQTVDLTEAVAAFALVDVLQAIQDLCYSAPVTEGTPEIRKACERAFRVLHATATTYWAKDDLPLCWAPPTGRFSKGLK